MERRPPRTADDFIFTWKTLMNPNYEIASRSGYDSITRAKRINAKTVRFTFSKTYAPYAPQLPSGASAPRSSGSCSKAGASLEHLDINVGAKSGNPLLRQKWFRQAITYSLDRRGMTRQLFRTLNPSLRELNSLSFTVQHPSYQAKFAKYTRNVSRATQLFRSHGCKKGGDGIYTCGGQRASVRISTTAGNRLRELAVEIMQAQAKAAGIEFRPDNQPSRLQKPTYFVYKTKLKGPRQPDAPGSDLERRALADGLVRNVAPRPDLTRARRSPSKRPVPHRGRQE